MNKKSRILLLTILGALLIVALAVGTSYAFWKITKVQPGDANSLSTTCLNLTLTNGNETTGITLDTQYPISDEEGKKTTGYQFIVKNFCDTYVTYDINLESLNTVAETDRMNLNYLDAIIDDGKVKLLGNYPATKTALKTNEAYDTRKLKTDTIAPGTTDAPTTKEYTLRVWMDEEVEGTDAMSKTWKGKVSIFGWPVSEMPTYADASGAEAPDLNNGLIPVVYNTATKEWLKADTSTKWYDYDEQWWANAVTVSSSSRDRYTNAQANTPISMDDIETMWVWIPRYEYNYKLLEVTENYGGTEENKGAQTEPKGIEINFISKDTVTASSNSFVIHDAFWWGEKNDDGSKKEGTGEELAGIWVAKFEMSSNKECEASNDVGINCDVTDIVPRIKPNVTSWRGARIGTMWTVIHQNMNSADNSYGLTNTDAHLMKNMEWGAVAYLSQSKYGKYGNVTYAGVDKEVYMNQNTNFITGSSNGTTRHVSTADIEYTYNVEKQGTGASTTGNIYGIYDMSGGASEYVMGVQAVKDSNPLEPMVGTGPKSNSGWSGTVYDSDNWTQYPPENDTETVTYGSLKDISNKYYDLYNYGAGIGDYTRGHLGDATKETKGWYTDESFFLGSGFAFLRRGGTHTVGGMRTGVFSFNRNVGISASTIGGRPVAVHAS